MDRFLFPVACAIGLLIGSAIGAPAALASDLKIANASIEMPILDEAPTAFFILSNRSQETRTLVGGSCIGCDDVEIRRAVLKDGAMGSEVISEWEVPAGGDVAFIPRGLSLSLVGLKDLSEGDSVQIELEFDNGETLAFDAIASDE